MKTFPVVELYANLGSGTMSQAKDADMLDVACTYLFLTSTVFEALRDQDIDADVILDLFGFVVLLAAQKTFENCELRHNISDEKSALLAIFLEDRLQKYCELKKNEQAGVH